MMATVSVGAVATFDNVIAEHRYPSGEWAVFGTVGDGIHAIQLDDATHGSILVEWPEGAEHRATDYWQAMMAAR